MLLLYNKFIKISILKQKWDIAEKGGACLKKAVRVTAGLMERFV